MDTNTCNRVREAQCKITMLDRGRFFSKHAGGSVYYDSKHRVYRVPLDGGFMGG